MAAILFTRAPVCDGPRYQSTDGQEDLAGKQRRPLLATLLPTKFANLFQRNAASVSAPESAEWFTFQRNFFILKTGATQ